MSAKKQIRTSLEKQFLSPSAVGKKLGCGTEKVKAFIDRGELRAINTSLSDKPRWKVDPSDFDAFCERRASVSAAKPNSKDGSQ